MPKPTPTRDRTDCHKDGSVRARGKMLEGELHGYWEWFRIDGTRMRSGHFDRGVKVGEWVTYDQAGKIYRVTQVKTKPPTR